MENGARGRKFKGRSILKDQKSKDLVTFNLFAIVSWVNWVIRLSLPRHKNYSDRFEFPMEFFCHVSTLLVSLGNLLLFYSLVLPFSLFCRNWAPSRLFFFFKRSVRIDQFSLSLPPSPQKKNKLNFYFRIAGIFNLTVLLNLTVFFYFVHFA